MGAGGSTGGSSGGASSGGFGGYGSTRSPGGTGYGGDTGGYGTAGEMSGGAGGAGMAGYGGGGQAGVAGSGWGGGGGAAGRQPAGGTYSNSADGRLHYSPPGEGRATTGSMAGYNAPGVGREEGQHFKPASYAFKTSVPKTTSALSPGFISTAVQSKMIGDQAARNYQAGHPPGTIGPQNPGGYTGFGPNRYGNGSMMAGHPAGPRTGGVHASPRGDSRTSGNVIGTGGGRGTIGGSGYGGGNMTGSNRGLNQR